MELKVFDRFLFILIVVVGYTSAWAPSALSSETKNCEQDYVCLSQGWTGSDRHWWYTVSQGSRLLPLDWFFALEQPSSTEMLSAKNNMQKWGYIFGSRGDTLELPLGFAVDQDSSRSADLMCDELPATCDSKTMRQSWVGMNCAACHTARLKFQDTVVGIDGAPSLADFEGFTSQVLEALKKTVGQSAKFERFAGRVLRNRIDVESYQDLKVQLTEQIAWQVKLRNKNSGKVIAGHGRVDAQGHILNKVGLILGAGEQPIETFADAPASYPHIWNAGQQESVQWNGIAKNAARINLRNAVTDIGALIRNTSEVVGVFAHVDVAKRTDKLGYRSSVRVGNLIKIERKLSQLKSPRWPEALFGKINWKKALAGKSLFAKHCAGCHKSLAPDDLQSPAQEKMVSLRQSGTDIFLACNAFRHKSLVGKLAGRKQLVYFGERILASEDFTRNMLANISVGSIVGQVDELSYSLLRDFFFGSGQSKRETVDVATVEYLPGVTDLQKKREARDCLTRRAEILAYKARPLNGVWATAPYLHNGSVPTIFDLLLPSDMRLISTDPLLAQGQKTRPNSFDVSSEFDPLKVGLKQKEQGSQFKFRTRDEDGAPIPGNYNSGHDYGNAKFTDDQRWQLIEYIKSL